MQAKLRAEEAERAFLEAQRRAAKDAAEREATKTLNKAAAGVVPEEAPRTPTEASLGTLSAKLEVSENNNRKKSPSAGSCINTEKCTAYSGTNS